MNWVVTVVSLRKKAMSVWIIIVYLEYNRQKMLKTYQMLNDQEIRRKDEVNSRLEGLEVNDAPINS